MARPKRTCTIEGCERPHMGRGYCGPHLYRFQKFGDPLGGRHIRVAGDSVERLMLLYRVEESTGHWLWTASLGEFGYGQVRWGGTMRRAHRVVYAVMVGPIPPGMVLDHLCGVRHCVNPAHLEPVTQRVNMARAVKPHCKNGHEWTTETTIVRKGGKRLCRTCNRAYQRERYHQLVTRRT